MMKTFFSSLLLASAVSQVSAQNILSDIRQDVPGQGHVTVNQSVDIERLIVEPKQPNGSTQTQTPGTSQKPGTTAATQPKQERQSEPSGTATPQTSVPKPVIPETDETAASDSKKIMRRSYKATGYRIQVYSGGNKRSDREKCEEIARRLKASIPGLPVYVHFYSPSWKCRAGNFTSIEDAQRVLSQVKSMGYSQACLVKGTINVAY